MIEGAPMTGINPSEKNKVTPLHIPHMPIVAIKGGTLKRVTKIPLPNPGKIATQRATALPITTTHARERLLFDSTCITLAPSTDERP
ncbi:MAG: hypothetical protein BWX81_01315 [Spirochaetes bacterium ADurb.Bin110]|nr:MAG: hypothetical protein BWX81_01315 [Spirochaetes bacterium ADurb.Bin110]